MRGRYQRAIPTNAARSRNKTINLVSLSQIPTLTFIRRRYTGGGSKNQAPNTQRKDQITKNQKPTNAQGPIPNDARAARAGPRLAIWALEPGAYLVSGVL